MKRLFALLFVLFLVICSVKPMVQAMPQGAPQPCAVENIALTETFSESQVLVDLKTESYQNNFDTAYQADWYHFWATQDVSYVIDISMDDNLTPVVQLYDKDCQLLEIDEIPLGDGARLQWTHHWPSDWYYLLVYEAYSRSGVDASYRLSFQADP